MIVVPPRTSVQTSCLSNVQSSIVGMVAVPRRYPRIHSPRAIVRTRLTVGQAIRSMFVTDVLASGGVAAGTGVDGPPPSGLVVRSAAMAPAIHRLADESEG